MLQELAVLASASIQNHYSQLCATKTTPTPVNLRDLPSCTSTYEAGLQEAAALQQQSVKQREKSAWQSIANLSSLSGCQLLCWLHLRPSGPGQTA